MRKIVVLTVLALTACSSPEPLPRQSIHLVETGTSPATTGLNIARTAHARLQSIKPTDGNITMQFDAEIPDALGNPVRRPLVAITWTATDVRSMNFDGLEDWAVLDLAQHLKILSPLGAERLQAYCSQINGPFCRLQDG